MGASKSKSPSDVFHHKFKVDNYTIKIKNVGHGVCNIKKELDGGIVHSSHGILHFKQTKTNSIKFFDTHGLPISEFFVDTDDGTQYYRYVEYNARGSYGFKAVVI